MIAKAAPPSPAQPVPPPAGQPSSSAPQRRQEPQKQALAALLRLRFGAVEREARFPWLTVPPSDQTDGTILAIYHALQGMRGYSTFASFGKPLCCDFFVPAERTSARPIAICQACPVLAQCRSWALTKHERYGVWGGLSQDDRWAIWRGRAPKRSYLRKPKRTRRHVA